MKVPDVLISGNHAKITEYRKLEQIKRTGERRPELLEKYRLSEKEIHFEF